MKLLYHPSLKPTNSSEPNAFATASAPVPSKSPAAWADNKALGLNFNQPVTVGGNGGRWLEQRSDERRNDGSAEEGEEGTDEEGQRGSEIREGRGLEGNGAVKAK